jgi:transitional endoplasmic reticulum ATPase
MRFFEAALKETRASVTPELEREYADIAADLKRESPRSRRFGFQV